MIDLFFLLRKDKQGSTLGKSSSMKSWMGLGFVGWQINLLESPFKMTSLAKFFA